MCVREKGAVSASELALATLARVANVDVSYGQRVSSKRLVVTVRLLGFYIYTVHTGHVVVTSYTYQIRSVTFSGENLTIA